MCYREFIPDTIKEEVHSWNLNPGLSRALWATLLDELGTRDETGFRRAVAPIRGLIVPVSVVDPETNTTKDFVFYVDCQVREGERTVVEAIDLSKPISAPAVSPLAVEPHFDPS